MEDEELTAKQKAELLKHERECVEEELFGNWTIRLRNAGGILAAVTTCIIAIFNAFTTHVSVTNGNGWPSETTMLIVNIGPILIAWSYMKANKMIETILEVGGIGERIRSAVVELVTPKTNRVTEAIARKEDSNK